MLKQLLFGSSIKEPTFIKDFSEENKQIRDLENLLTKVKTDKSKLIENDLKLLKYGLIGEKNIRFELKNSFIPMLILHDIRLEHEGYVAQMDYIIISPHFILILETKRLAGNIYIDASGDFIRSLPSKNGKYFKEGIKSPIEQNERHVRILTKALKDNNLLKNLNILSCVTVANPSSIVSKSKAPKDIQNKIIKFDQLTKYLHTLTEIYKPQSNVLDKKLFEIANFLKNNHKETNYDYSSKYSLTAEDFVHVSEKPIIQPKQDATPLKTKAYTNIQKPIQRTKSDKELEAELKSFRLSKSKEKDLAAYCIFTNKTLDALIKERPKTKDDLLKIQGIGEVKAESYGPEILRILN